MYNASTEFHQAVANGADQIALLIFDHTDTVADKAVFTNDDINVTSGIEFNDYFNTEEDITIGTALSNELSFSIFNDSGLLDEYEFGKFTATIGAQISEMATEIHKRAYAESGSHIYTTFASSPYIKRDGTALNTQPSSPVISILIYGGKVYCGLENGDVKVYKDSDGSFVISSINDFMKAQMQKWNGRGFRFGQNNGTGNNMLTIWERNVKKVYEFVPLGVFVAERPNVPTVNEIHFTCYDEMQNFEKDMMTDAELLTELQKTYSTRSAVYPLSFADLYLALCSKAGVTPRSTTFINSTATISKRLDDFDNVTMREVLQWIAEAAASVARIDRDGYIKMDWLRTTSLTIDETGYSDFSPYWYETKRVTKLYNRASSGDYNNSIGDGTEAYLIQDNPLLKGVS